MFLNLEISEMHTVAALTYCASIAQKVGGEKNLGFRNAKSKNLSDFLVQRPSRDFAGCVSDLTRPGVFTPQRLLDHLCETADEHGRLRLTECKRRECAHSFVLYHH